MEVGVLVDSVRCLDGFGLVDVDIVDVVGGVHYFVDYVVGLVVDIVD